MCFFCKVAAVERKGGYNQLCDIWACGITAIGDYKLRLRFTISENAIFIIVVCCYRIG